MGELSKLDKSSGKPESRNSLAKMAASQLEVYKKKSEPRFDNWLVRIDNGIKYLTKKNYSTGNEPMDDARMPIVLGIWLTIFIFVFFGLWAVLAPMSSAAVARGVVVVESNKKLVQHLEGGIVSEILVKDGDIVKAGDPLVKLSPTGAQSRQDTIVSQLRLYKAEEARLTAERDGQDKIDFSNIPLLADTNNDEVKKIIASQQLYFESRRSALQGELNVLQQKVKESSDDIRGLQAQEAAADAQLKYLEEEIGTVRELFKSGQALKPRLLQLERNESELRGNKGQYTSLIAKAKQTIAETQLQMINAKTDFLSKIAAESKEVEANVSDLQEKLSSSTDILNREVITAPQDGKITNLAIHTVGGVVPPGSTLMEIVPQNDKFIIEAQVSPQDIDVVHPGLAAKVRLSAFKSRRVPMIDGNVIYVSADRIADQRNPQIQPYFLARIEVDQAMIDRLKDVKLYPGMPADVYIITGKRTLMSYLMDPVTDTFYKAFKEK